MKILTKKEKKYLKRIIKPFRHKVKWVVKRRNREVDYVKIGIEELGARHNVTIPCLQVALNFANMKKGKLYRLKDLEI